MTGSRRPTLDASGLIEEIADRFAEEARGGRLMLDAGERMILMSSSDRVADELRRRIRDARLPLGSKFPSDQAIADEFQVSRTVVREAVARLKSDGLVETRKGAATRVRSTGRDAERLVMPRSMEGLLGFLEVRGAIEAEMAALAATRRTAAQGREIRACLRAIDAATRAGGSGVQEDLEFHLAIGRATSNAYWGGFVRLFAVPMRSAINVTRANERRRQDFTAAVASEHREIYLSILAQDAARARDAVRFHIRNAGERILQAGQEFWSNEGADLARVWQEEALQMPAVDSGNSPSSISEARIARP